MRQSFLVQQKHGSGPLRLNLVVRALGVTLRVDANEGSAHFEDAFGNEVMRYRDLNAGMRMENLFPLTWRAARIAFL